MKLTSRAFASHESALLRSAYAVPNDLPNTDDCSVHALTSSTLIKMITFGFRCRIGGGGCRCARVAQQSVRRGWLVLERGQERIGRRVRHLVGGRQTIVPTATVCAIIARCCCRRRMGGRGRV